MENQRLLVIDDEEAILQMVKEHFELRGFEVFSASDGEEGLELATKTNPHVILLDLKMKKTDGEKILPQLRLSLPQTKIFVVSAHQEETTKKKLQEEGIDSFFEKPVSILELEQIIRKCLG